MVVHHYNLRIVYLGYWAGSLELVQNIIKSFNYVCDFMLPNTHIINISLLLLYILIRKFCIVFLIYNILYMAFTRIKSCAHVWGEGHTGLP